MKSYTYAIRATMLQLGHCNYCTTMLQLHMQQCANDVLTNHQWTCHNFKFIFIFSVLSI
jgi:hypothetical protein